MHRLVELHGGMITARSDGPGLGSSFTVRVPAADAPAQVASATAPPAPTRALTVLVVEDNDDARVSLQMVLEADGHAVHAAADGRSGLAAFEQVRPDVALIDIGLPGMDGYEVARAIRARRPEAILIALTGYGQPEDARRAADAGFDAHLVKPADIARLRALLARRRRSDA